MKDNIATILKEFSFKSSAINEKERTIRFLASTPDIDRDDQRIDYGGKLNGTDASDKHQGGFRSNVSETRPGRI